MNERERLDLVAAANRAPSVHNIQPARFKFVDERTIEICEDPARRLLVGDPAGNDNLKSLGAAIEGLALALSERGLGAEIVERRACIISGGAPDRLAPLAATRASYRGAFATPNEHDRAALEELQTACDDLHVLASVDARAEIARLFDDVSMEVLRDRAYRAELLSWMRLSPRHANFSRDGLNAPHMALSAFEAAGAGVVLGCAFPLLDAIGLAKPLIAESGKVRSAAATALFHRPADEDELETGRRFYRVWLEVERVGLALCPMSVLADVPRAASRLLNEANLKQRKLVTVFRIGRRPANFVQSPRVRLPARELILS
ncbi:dinucleotide-utilizing enzymes [alpha proteobacterium U9-1i]|nr:dinucleotide-utilizing enzymes [alpha proteobacterium U9-1i]